MENTIKTNIDGLLVKINKVIGDERGVLCELYNDLNKCFFKNGIKNIYTSIATGKHIPRAGHYHFKNQENFYTLSGTALWLFIDYRKGSPTFNKYYFVILGFEKINNNSIDSFTIDNSKMAQVFVPAGVYHIFWPLNEKPVTVLAIASEIYKKEDYNYPDIKKLKEIKETLLNFNINL